MGKFVITYADHTNEVATATFPGSDLVEANITAELAQMNALLVALGNCVLGNVLRTTTIAKVSPMGVGPSAIDAAQRESKALVRYHDADTYKKATLEIPCPDLTDQHPSFPGKFFVAGDANNPADWSTMVSAFEAYVLGPDGGAAVVDEIIHVGRNL